MFLELSQAKDYLQVNIRPLVKEAKALGLSLHLFFEGHAYQSITFNLSHQGPIFERSSIHFECYAVKDDQYTTYHTYLDLNRPIDHTNIIEALQQKLSDAPLSFDATEYEPLIFDKHTNSHVDEELLNNEIADLTDIFRSRFLIDSPRKMLYETDLRRGLVFQAYWDEQHTLQYVEHSYFGLRAKLRTENVFINTEYNGKTLRELRLLPIRQHLQPWWSLKSEDIDIQNLPNNIVLSSLALLKFNLALSQEIRLENHLIWNWLREIGPDKTYPLQGLSIQSINDDHPLKSAMTDFFGIQEHPSGSLDTTLEDILNAKQWIVDNAIYIQDIHIEVDGGHFWVTNIGSTLLMSRESNHKIIHGQLEFIIEGEAIQGAQCSSKQHWFFPSEAPEPYYVPQYAVLKEMDLSKKHI